jgi:predicted HTH transcriptional regulator
MVNETALREVLVNAIVHNDYSREVPPVVEIFSDRLTITSYGGLPQGLSRENFFRCRSLPLNMVLFCVKQNPNFTLDQIAEHTELPKRTVSRNMKLLQETGAVKRVGSPKTGHWEVVG